MLSAHGTSIYYVMVMSPKIRIIKSSNWNHNMSDEEKQSIKRNYELILLTNMRGVNIYFNKYANTVLGKRFLKEKLNEFVQDWSMRHDREYMENVLRLRALKDDGCEDLQVLVEL